MHYRKVTRSDNEEVLLDTDMIRLLIAIDETKALGRIAQDPPTSVRMESSKLQEQPWASNRCVISM